MVRVRLTIVVVAPFTTSVSDQRLPPIDHPFSFRSGPILTNFHIWSHPDADDDVPLRFLCFRFLFTAASMT